MQSKLESIAEAFLNTFSAYILSVLVFYYFIPLIVEDVEPSFTGANITVTVHTILSLIRNYFWRRYFNSRLKRKLWQDYQNQL